MSRELAGRLKAAAAVALAWIGGLPCAGQETVFPGKDWEQATPASQRLDADKLQAAADYLRANSGRDGVRELAIVRNGRLVWRGEGIDKVHGIWSCTKSFTSTVLGLLIEDGKCSLDTP